MTSLTNAPIHLGIPTTNFDQAKKFYRDVLELKIVYEVPGVAMFEAGQGTKLELFSRGEPANAQHTLGGFTVEDIEATVAELETKGVKFMDYDEPGYKTVNHIAPTGPNSRCAWIKDPDGNYLVITEWKK
jgi:predicted enzyme related to lactoylglutathione lyase